MTTLRRFTCDDLFKFTNVNTDIFTETVYFFLCSFLCLFLFTQYSLGFYMEYLSHWPECCMAAISPMGRMMGYCIFAIFQLILFTFCVHSTFTKLVLGKVEGSSTITPGQPKTGVCASLHGHVTAVTVAPEYRTIGLASAFMNCLENTTVYTYL
jgi:N-terminal acetyltransferase B complex catalytic subunit